MRLDQFSESISVVIPAYNEAKRLPATLAHTHDFLQQHVQHFELLVVDDGSTDTTSHLVNTFAQTHSHVRLVTLDRNQGKGAAVRRGLLEATGRWRVYMDADGSTDISQLRWLPTLAARGQVLVGSRHLSSSAIATPQPKTRVLLGHIARAAYRLIVPGIRDAANGFKIVRDDVVQKVVPQMTLTRWVFDVELLYLARRAGYTLLEFPITWRDARESRFVGLRSATSAAREYFALVRNIVSGRYR
jgi:dolichyl-phosphate beta-glucosyltransferase